MGKPFKRELELVETTYQWACRQDLDMLTAFVLAGYGEPLVAIGSGGSLSAASYAARLHELTGGIAKSITPFEFVASGTAYRSANIVLLSASGRNPDILSAARYALTLEPKSVVVLSTQAESPLADLAKKHARLRFTSYSVPAGKDGFLATNSLVLFITLLFRAYSSALSTCGALPEYFSSTVPSALYEQAASLLPRQTWAVLYGHWGYPAAVDLESKMTEAALGRALISDYRNFGHGRHHWFAKRASESAIVAMIGGDDEGIAEKTLSVLPPEIPVLRLTTPENGPASTLRFLGDILHLVGALGDAREIDPGRPGVPPFGRKIYRLRPPHSDLLARRPKGMNRTQAAAILRKSGLSSFEEFTADELAYWRGAYRSFKKRLEGTRFATLVLDYDGTLCSPFRRFHGLGEKHAGELSRLLRHGAIIGIATGRGKSVRMDLQRVLAPDLWHRVVVGYYNGSDIGVLNDNKRPDKSRELDECLKIVDRAISRNHRIGRLASIEVRPDQITITPHDVARWRTIRDDVIDVVCGGDISGVRVLASSHSLDIVGKNASKLHVVDECKRLAAKLIAKDGDSVEFAALAIGDRARWPGNDYELLSIPSSISVDTVSSDPDCAWNLNEPGDSGTEAALKILRRLEVDENGYFYIK